MTKRRFRLDNKLKRYSRGKQTKTTQQNSNYKTPQHFLVKHRTCGQEKKHI